ncbi:hypothetical protein SSX86_021994 [Deinandra increscens subsp. villosa]|uniref:Uncharacterized protein n=1 Tax=Deinandra increscens subsp. villosa TaxID=3103831 RepID=A0AAP0CMC8_9ASTR
MNSIFSSFDALSAEFLGQSVNFFNAKYHAAPAACAVEDDQKKVTTHGSTAVRRRSKGGVSGRWAPEFDGLHCFESLVFH